MEYVVVGAGAIGGTVGARLARDGHEVLFSDVDAEHVAAMNECGLSIEGPVEEFSVPARAVPPAGLPHDLRCVLLAVKAQDTQSAVAADRASPRSGRLRRLAPERLERVRHRGSRGEERTVGAFVNFGADYLGPGRIFLGGRGAFRVGELDGRRSERVERLAATSERRR